MAGIDQFGMLVLDIEVNRTRRATFKNDHVPAGHLELAAELPPGIRTGDRACQSALGHRRPTATGRGHRAGQWPGGDDELVVRRERIDLRNGLRNHVEFNEAPKKLNRTPSTCRSPRLHPSGQSSARSVTWPTPSRRYACN